MFAELAQAFPAHLAQFGRGIDAEQLRLAASPQIRVDIIKKAHEAASKPWSVILANHYRDYTRTGNRTRFEELYFSRRLKLNALVLGECLEGDGRFLDEIIDGLWLICEESGWQLPAHNSHIRGGARAPMPDIDHPVIDLFAAETGANLALCLHLLAPELDRTAPGTTERVRDEIGKRITRPYLSEHFWWMGSGDERMNNWTAWITQNVLLSTFLLPHDDTTQHQVARKALNSLDAFQKDYGADGACEEGVLYYGHAALCLFGAMTILDEVTGGKLKPLFHSSKIRNMAEFILHMHVSDSRYFNFADAPANYETAGIREYLFGAAVGSQQLQAFAADRWDASTDRLITLEWNLWYRVLALLTSDKMTASTAAAATKDALYPSIGLFIARDSTYDLAVKAGTNGESHNHNDVGSFTLYKNGKPLLIDVGVGSYTAKTFSASRYDIWTMQSAYHNLPIIGGIMQSAGSEYCARDFKAEFNEERACVSFDISGAYPSPASSHRYLRSVRLVRHSHIEVQDTYEGDDEIQLVLMSLEAPVFEAGKLHLGDLAQIGMEGCGLPSIETIPIDDARLRQSWPEQIYRIVLKASEKSFRLIIR
ncbi:heparinase II/III family protein [Agrobacterium larrymoorei]|uniref:Heparinase n=1 Tax=Agrobacterium larrymoorei TaxID=160699 RepID=A0A4D7DQ56_9HYPH|nr:heparinase II/III family protein [Agrobacterium larrymoorei]QCI99375.1 heparinase [Agrobacterium larrymoorei]QYA08917.1 heparinase II/III family protein [Agrobacterium larrymoorei]